MNSSAGPQVAVVDDDRAILESIADLMASAGISAITFESAPALLKWGQLHALGCLVTDVRMPDMDGWQLVDKVRAQRPGLPVILITAHDSVECDATAHLAKLGSARLLRKPFDPKLLLEAVQQALHTRS
jgi:two-component system, LuxR family, response regulator FixJ